MFHIYILNVSIPKNKKITHYIIYMGIRGEKQQLRNFNLQISGIVSDCVNVRTPKKEEKRRTFELLLKGQIFCNHEEVTIATTR